MRAAVSILLLAALAVRAAPPAAAPAEEAERYALAPLDRMHLARLLVPADPHLQIQARLPASRVLNEAELTGAYREKRANNYLGVVTWKDLMVNFARRARYAEARECLNRALKAEELTKTEAALFLAWFLERLGDFKTALTGYEEVLSDTPADLVPQQRRVSCLVSLYRPLAARQALDTYAVENGRLAGDAWSHHMRGLMALLINDTAQAHVQFLHAWRQGDRHPLPESAAGLALLALLDASPEECVGWLKRAMDAPDRLFRIRLLHQAAWTPLHEHPAFQDAVAQGGWTFDPSRPLATLLAEAELEAAGALASLQKLPEGYVEPLKLQQHEPGTRTRTLTGLLNPEILKQDAP